MQIYIKQNFSSNKKINSEDIKKIRSDVMVFNLKS